MNAVAADAVHFICTHCWLHAFQWKSVGVVENAKIAILEAKFGLFVVDGLCSIFHMTESHRFCT